MEKDILLLESGLFRNQSKLLIDYLPDELWQDPWVAKAGHWQYAGHVSTMNMTSAEVATLTNGQHSTFNFADYVFNKETSINQEASTPIWVLFI